ncbi:hypothetical protein CHO01_22400 [Cellulomonas hominis]|uniref:Uncharacterized protein n=1 Tax=Cellulomonas hominis TaxID=156981 RepID=A0A511FEV7_9CELL|nr:hypothetical protein [Cellulomonas hominis]MBB5475215.1 hypothetical protein [Cellulomonas hominis]GEL47124.1 hypothetical protein CHO01_22400 [Cellulomonas hominis]
MNLPDAEWTEAPVSLKTEAWAYFDRIISDAAPDSAHSNPWVREVDGRLSYEPDFDTLERLLSVPLHLRATTQTGVPALALDVWLSHELRRAGFGPDSVWPRASHPRILPQPVANLIAAAPRRLAKEIEHLLRSKATVKEVTSASASILGKNYLKQVDVIMSDWQTGPEILISTKRMDSSFGKNAANRIEESYGDAKNLRLRHPLAALGFVFGLRSTILQEEPEKAEWLIDLLEKLGREDDAYHATCLVMLDYGGEIDDDDTLDADDALVAAGLESDPEADEGMPVVAISELEGVIAAMPAVRVQHASIPDALSPATFLATMVRRVLDTTPVTLHRDARARLKRPRDRE